MFLTGSIVSVVYHVKRGTGSIFFQMWNKPAQNMFLKNQVVSETK